MPVIVPLLVAAALSAGSSYLPRRLVDSIAILVALAVALLCTVLAIHSISQPIVYWFGGWEPRDGIAIGISFVVQPLGAGLAALAAILTAAAFLFSWRYFESVGTLFHVLMLTFLAAMSGFCLTGDLFNLFVFFELMSVSAFALTGYKIEESGPLQGALNFAVSVSVAAFLILSGIGLIYARTGALNLARIGVELSSQQPDSLVIVAFVLLTAGFLIKAAAVPFHFWLADAEAVAPNPVCAVFSGAMVAMGVYGVVLLYWTVFAGVLGSEVLNVRAILLVFGAVTAVLGGVLCFLQVHLKRLLAFSTVSHVGIFIIGAALLSPLGLAGAVVYVIGHGLVKSSLFLCTGILTHRFGTVAQNQLHGRGRVLPVTATVFVLGGLGLAGVPPFGTFLGKGLIEDSASKLGYHWVTLVLVIASALTGGAVLRAAGHVFVGWGPYEEDVSSEDQGEERQPETGGERRRTPLVMIVPTCVLMVAGLLISLLPELGPYAERVSELFQTPSRYVATVLYSSPLPPFSPEMEMEPADPTLSMAVSGLISAALAVCLAALSLFRRRWPERVRSMSGRLGLTVVSALRNIHSGHVGDYVTWLMVGVFVLGAVFALTVR